ncbi:MAG: GGDEF domain-containing protein [Kangiellaceae bacterium]|nr:GGDEF domain-containing protein [Kangiellaceae bacterium]MCW9000035.1 GGDEF domain-containing protein [Kangiellaceae bacterium]MCW9017343.1 GGDEF domain-containing protein [Kangiellaceae bacterium]
MQGIHQVFEKHENVELFVNYMDTKRRSEPDYFELLRDLYATKYQHFKFDAIISSDDHALDFLLQYRDELFPQTPVVFSGLNAFTPDRIKGHAGYTGVYESYDVAGTIDLIRQLHPSVKQIAAITDETRSGNIFKSLLESAEQELPSQLKINYLHNYSPEKLITTLQQLPENAIVLWAIYLRLPSGSTFSSSESVKLVSESSRLPTYCVWDVVGQGVVGGKITSPNFQGETAANLVLKIFDGTAADNIPVTGSPLVNIFDFHFLEKFSIDLDRLPSNSIVKNKPQSIYEQYREYVWIFSVIIFLLLVTIIFLVAIILLKRHKDKFEGMAMHDQLTGLYNRHYLQEVAAHKLAEALRHGYSLCLLVLDLDHFKKINDTHGHIVGDFVLQELSVLLENFSRGEDIVARIGGEEFVMLLDHCNVAEAKGKALVIKDKVSQLNPRGIPITISIGIASLKESGEPFSKLLDRADKAVYIAKNQGRNCVVTV